MADIYNGIAPHLLTGPYIGGFAVTASAAQLAQTTRAIYINVSGALTIITPRGETLTFANMPVGIHTLRATHITACPAGTIGLY